jgi:uncharacterized protein DUF4153
MSAANPQPRQAPSLQAPSLQAPSLQDPSLQAQPVRAQKMLPPPSQPPAHQAAPPPLHGPWPAASPWARGWPGAARPAAPLAVVAIVAAALITAVSLPLDRPGLGWLIAALAGSTAVAVSAEFRRPPLGPPPLVVRRPPGPDRDRFGWGAATVVLLGVGTFRAAGWLFLLCLLVATLTATLALVGGRSVPSIVTAYLMPPIATFRSIGWLGGGLRRIRAERAGPSGGGFRVVATGAVSIALLVVFGALLASADAHFADALAAVLPGLSLGTFLRWTFVFGVALLVLGGAAFLRAAPPNLAGLAGPEARSVRRLEWAIPLSLLVLLFAAFVAVQLTELFGGDRHVRDTDGLTYAGYARGGFWQLSFVTGLTLLVMAGAARWAPRRDRADRVLLRVVLGPLTVLALIIVASAIYRVNVYTDAYGLTRLRLLVACCAGWFGLVLVLVLLAGVRLRAAWLPRVAIAAGVAALIGLAVANPDRLIAERNLAMDRSRLDLAYLSTLSPDAVPALTALAPADRACVLGELSGKLARSPDVWRQWNLGRARARDILANYRRLDYPQRAACS